MSNALLTQAWPLQMPPTPKAVLVAMADVASDAGACWPSIKNLCERTCFGKSAVIEAIKWLESNSLLRADRSDRYRTTYVLTLAAFTGVELVRQADKSVSRTTPVDGGLVRLAEDEVRQPENEVRQPDTTHQDPSVPISKAPIRKRASALSVEVEALLADVDPKVVRDWLAVRKAKKAAVTETAIEDLIREAEKLGLTLQAALRMCCTQGWAAVKASWPQAQQLARAQGQGPPGKPGAADSFHGKTYIGDSDDQLPAFLRPAPERAA